MSVFNLVFLPNVVLLCSLPAPEYLCIYGFIEQFIARDYTLQIIITHRPVFSVSLRGNGFNGGRSSSSGLTSSEAGNLKGDRIEHIASNSSFIVACATVSVITRRLPTVP
jgi:hypothetical protein